MTTATQALAQYSSALNFADIPKRVITRVQHLLMDLAGIMIAAQRLNSTRALKAVLSDLYVMGGEGIVPGTTERWSFASAALINAAAAHSLDFDDTHVQAEIHPGAVVIPAALAAAQMVNATPQQFFSGVVAGYEVMCRVARGLSPAAGADRGFHITAIAGVFGAAAAAGNLLSLSAEAMTDAFGTALSQAAGSRQFLTNGAWTKRFHVGQAAASGVLAAALARRGYRGASESLEGQYGFFALYATQPDAAAAFRGLGTVWETLAVGIKPYPCCRAIHAALDAVRDLKRQHSMTVESIRSISIGLPRKAFDLTAVPPERKMQPRNLVDCQFSAQFCVAAMLQADRVPLDDEDAILADTQILELAQRVSCFIDARAQAEYPQAFAASVCIKLEDGKCIERFVRQPSGEPTSSLSASQLRAKFAALVIPTLGATGESTLYEAIEALPGATSLTSFLKSMQPLATASEQLKEPVIEVFWRPQCSSCQRVKEYLREREIEFISVNVEENVAALSKLKRLGIRGAPVLVRGKEFVYAQSLKDVAQFLNIVPPESLGLSNSELLNRINDLLAASVALVKLMPASCLDLRLSGRDRTGRDLSHHIFNIAAVFMESVQGGELSYERITAELPAEFKHADAEQLAAYGLVVCGQLSNWRQSLTVFPEMLSTFYGAKPFGEVLERTAWHCAHHARQLREILEQHGVSALPLLPDEMLRRLPVPQGIFDERPT